MPRKYLDIYNLTRGWRGLGSVSMIINNQIPITSYLLIITVLQQRVNL